MKSDASVLIGKTCVWPELFLSLDRFFFPSLKNEKEILTFLFTFGWGDGQGKQFIQKELYLLCFPPKYEAFDLLSGQKKPKGFCSSLYIKSEVILAMKSMSFA
uniref:Uncharacterized protein n=1 Tax=Micrurus lemniscatus lemniscatus TaxID=129467 RepID=A0A2D4IH84_MICLE